jgi:putative oxidoreductase
LLSEEKYVLDQLRPLHERILSLSRLLTWLPPLAARTSVGLVFVSAGWGKLHNLDQVIEFFRSLGIPAPEYQAPFVAATELSCGLLIVLGLGTRFAAVPLVVTMLVAIRTAVWSDLEGAIDLFGREEFLYIVLLAWLAIAGAGAASLDAILARTLRAPATPRPSTSLVSLPRHVAQRP